MQKYTKVSNGHTLTIEINKEGLFAELDEDIKKMEDLKTEIAKKGEDAVAAECYDSVEEFRYDYDMQKVYGEPESDFCTPDEIINDRNDFKETIKKLIVDNGETLWKMVQLKKNGTFKKTSKPTIREAINGSYWEDSYGWHTLVLRLVPVNDTLARIELDTIVLHY